MTLMPYQQKVLDSDKKLNIFGFTSASGKSQTLVEILKRELLANRSVLFLVNSYKSWGYRGYYQYVVNQLKEVLEGTYSPSSFKFQTDNGDSVTFHSNPEQVSDYDTVLIESLHSFPENPLNFIPDSVSVYCSTFSANSPNHWLSQLLSGFYTEQGYLDLPNIFRNTSDDLELTVFPYGFNRYTPDEYYKRFTENMSEEEFKRLTMGYVNPNN